MGGVLCIDRQEALSKYNSIIIVRSQQAKKAFVCVPLPPNLRLEIKISVSFFKRN
jgi:hypothetical protein